MVYQDLVIPDINQVVTLPSLYLYIIVLPAINGRP